jgi:hypothetical protein
MSKKARLLAKLMAGNNDRAFTFDEGYAVAHAPRLYSRRWKRRHCVYRHPDGRKVVLPRHGKEVKPAYIKLIRKLLS